MMPVGALTDLSIYHPSCGCCGLRYIYKLGCFQTHHHHRSSPDSSSRFLFTTMTDLLQARWKEDRIAHLHKILGCPDVFESLLHKGLLSETLGLRSTGHYVTTAFMNDAQIAATPDARAKVMELLTRVDKPGGAVIEMEIGHIYQDPRFMPQPETRPKPYVREFATLDVVINGAAVVPQIVPESVMHPRYAPYYFKRTGFEGASMRANFGIPLQAVRANRRTPHADQAVRDMIGEEAATASPLMHAEGPIRLMLSVRITVSPVRLLEG